MSEMERLNVLHPTMTEGLGPLFGGLPAQTQATAGAGPGGESNGGFIPLYQIGGPRSIPLALKLQFYLRHNDILPARTGSRDEASTTRHHSTLAAVS